MEEAFVFWSDLEIFKRNFRALEFGFSGVGKMLSNLTSRSPSQTCAM